MTLHYGKWTAGIGDPTAIGWVTVVVYFLGAVLCFWASTRRKPVIYLREEVDSNPARFWLALGWLLVALGVNKQLDLQSLFTEVGRDLAQLQGWYRYRGKIQLVFILALATTGAIALVLAIRWLRHAGLAVKLALVGCIALFGFVLMRASSFHHMDLLLRFTLGGIKMNWMFELGSLSIIIVAAIMALGLRHKGPE